MESPKVEDGGDGDLNERLRSLLRQLRIESGILDRIVYKGKNQHCRCPYFKSLLKVRRDVRLLLSAGLEEILTSLFHIIDGKKPAQKFHMLEGLKRKHPSGKHNHHKRLLGVARLLSQMMEPILMAAIQFSSLLARSFFMGYSLINLALLARIRVLLQQILLDAVSLYNLVSDLSQRKHSIKLIQDGVEAFREYYPPCRKVLTLECLWEGDKFVLHERACKSKIKNQVEDLAQVLPEMPVIQYETIEISNEGAEPSFERPDKDFPVEDPVSPSDARCAPIDWSDQICRDIENEKLLINEESPSANSVPKVGFVANLDSSLNAKAPINQSSGKKVAFIPVGKAASSETNESRLHKKAKLDGFLKENTSEMNEGEDPFFSLLTAGCKKNKLI